jgi:hypothetical protein
MDYLACANCGCPITNGELCNLTCRREWLQKNKEAQGSQTTARDEVRAFVAWLINKQQQVER